MTRYPRPPAPVKCGLAALAALLLVTGCAHGAIVAGSHDAVSHVVHPETTPMPRTETATRAATTVVNADDARLQAGFDYDPASGTLHVRYRVSNQGDGPLAVFDRGDRQGVLTKRQAAGAVPSPLFTVDGNGEITLGHEALPLPQPSPTLPPVPLAAKLDAGGALAGEFSFTPPVSGAARRLRWCLGVAAFNDRDYTAPERFGEVEVWRASFAVVDAQQRLCTPWFELATGTFADG